MTPPVVPGPCQWDIDVTCVPQWSTYTPTVQTLATSVAVFILDAFTGHQFAQCPVTVRPCGPKCARMNAYQTWPVTLGSGGGSDWMIPFIVDGVWRDCGCGGGCNCSPACSIRLNGPVAEVTQVKVDGAVLTPSAYQLVGTTLARTDGGPCWPSCQDPSVPDTQAGTFSVTYKPGRALPPAGKYAAGLLAGELAKACNGGSCSLPGQLSSLTRQGVQVEMIPPSEVLTAGQTGIHEVDLFIQAVNPKGLRQRSRVFSPDVRDHPVVY